MRGLTVREIAAKRDPGMYGDGAGLYLHVAPGCTKSWIFRATVRGRTTSSGKPYRVEMGLGSYPMVSLAEARDKAAHLRKLAREGINPLDERRKGAITFAQAVERVHQHRKDSWKNEKHAAQWLATIERHAFPELGQRPVDTIVKADILRVLEPIWISTNETARRLQQRLSVVFDWAKSAGFYPHENPVTGIKGALAKVNKAPEHMKSMSWQELPSFMADLAKREGVSARALELLILTATRSGEVRGARWDEIEGNVWTIPAERMKAGKAHRVPLSAEALAVLDRTRGLHPVYIFPSPNAGRDGSVKAMSDMVFKALYDRMGREEITTHGFRSTFRVWCAESAHAEREVAEAALAHTIGNKVEQAYARTDLFERRRVLMDQWAAFADGQTA